LLHEASILDAQIKVEGMWSITNDIDAQSTTSTTLEEHDKTKTSTW